ncbi:MAG: toll/interleukin-1 receptor domain-containing protein [Clostridia bacterium]|nr:toll/interleukin-1 receptor domain-containing protein [Clostridia bacterium]
MFVDLRLANIERNQTNFDKAKSIYTKIIEANPNEDLTDVYWGLFLCEQRVLFEEDGKGEKFPSFYRLNQDKSIKESLSLEKALSYASNNKDKLEVFNVLAEKIEEARKMYLDIQRTTKPFDIFICFKNTDNNGNHTKDRQLAMEIYNEFSDKYNIFFSEKTLKDIKSSYRQYEPNIYYGLYTAKVMLLLCSKMEYLESKWLKNEWSRFSSINKQGTDNKCIIPIFTDGFDPKDLPESLWHNQGIFDDRKLINILETQLQNIIHPVDKLEELRKEQEEQRKEQERRLEEQERQRKEQEKLFNQKLEELKINNVLNGVNLDNMLKRAFQFLQDEEWDKALNQAERIFDIDVTIAQGYLVEMMSEYKLKNLTDFNKLDINDFENKNYKNALRYASEDYKQELLNLKNENIYNKALNKLKTNRLEAVKIFETIPNYKDSSQKIIDVKEEFYQNGVSFKNQAKYDSALKMFERILDYKDSKELAVESKNKHFYDKANNLYDKKQFDEAINLLNEIPDFLDSKQLIIEYQKEKK